MRKTYFQIGNGGVGNFLATATLFAVMFATVSAFAGTVTIDGITYTYGQDTDGNVIDPADGHNWWPDGLTSGNIVVDLGDREYLDIPCESSVGNLTLNSGSMRVSLDWRTYTGNLTVNGGRLELNEGTEFYNTTFVNGGTLYGNPDNGGNKVVVNDLWLGGGTLDGKLGGNVTVSGENVSTIITDGHSFEKLSFAQDGGTLRLVGSPLNVKEVSLAHGNLITELTGYGAYESLAAYITGSYGDSGFDLASLFSEGATLSGLDELVSFSFAVGEERYFLNAADGWTLNAGVYRLTADGGNGGAATPEPATLALFGLGLTGLAVLRRRKR